MPNPKQPDEKEADETQQVPKQPIVIEELARAWEPCEARLARRHAELSREGVNGTPLPEDDQREFTKIERELKQMADPVIVAVCQHPKVGITPPEKGVMESQRKTPPQSFTRKELCAIGVYWMLIRDGYDDPSASDFKRALNRRIAAYAGIADTYEGVMARWPDRPVRLRVLHQAVEEFVERGATVDDAAFNDVYEQVCKRQKHLEAKQISLAKVAKAATVDLVDDHVKAAAIVYLHEKLDAAGLFDSVDTILDDADHGRIDIGNKAIERLEDYRHDAEFRFPPPERLEPLRSRVLGPPFPPLWRGLVTAVHDYIARQTQFDLVGSRISARIAQEPVRVAALALTTHVSEAGLGTASTTARRLRRQIVEARRILSARSIVRAYGARDFLGVIERAGEIDISEITRQLALGEAGTTVLSFLAINAEILEEDDDVLLDDSIIGGSGSGDPIENPDTADFAAACEQLFQLLGCGQQPAAADEEEETDSEDDGQDEGDAFLGHSSYRQPGVFTLKPSMLAGGGEQ
jgi:hypothetical protein